MERLKQKDRKPEREKGKEKKAQRWLQRAENVFDNQMDYLMEAVSPEESVDADKTSEEVDETPIDRVDDEDFEDFEALSYNDIVFESEIPVAKPKRAFLAIAQVKGERKPILQNLKFPRFQNQKSDLEIKAKILKYIGNYIISDGGLLIDLVCSGKDLAREGNLGQKKLVRELNQNGKLKKKDEEDFTEKTLGEYISKIRRFESVQFPNGKIYSLTQVFRGEGKSPDEDQIEFLKFLVDRKEKGDTEIAEEYINHTGKTLTSATKKKMIDEYRSRFKNLKIYLRQHKQTIPNDWTPEESAEFYLSKRDLPFDKDLIKSVSSLFE